MFTVWHAWVLPIFRARSYVGMLSICTWFRAWIKRPACCRPGLSAHELIYGFSSRHVMYWKLINFVFTVL